MADDFTISIKSKMINVKFIYGTLVLDIDKVEMIFNDNKYCNKGYR